MQDTIYEAYPNREILFHCTVHQEVLCNCFKYEPREKQTCETCKVHTSKKSEPQTVQIPVTKSGCCLELTKSTIMFFDKKAKDLKSPYLKDERWKFDLAFLDVLEHLNNLNVIQRKSISL
jgi:hypothetical protein